MSPPRRRWLPGVLLSALLPLSLAATELSLSFPQDVRAGRDFAGWTKFEGQAELGSRRIAYLLYVDPRYSALYRLTRYRVTQVTRDGQGGDVEVREEEMLVWNARPGVREPLHCYALGDGPQPEGRWRDVAPGSDEYRTAMLTAVNIYSHHRNQRQASAP